MASEEKKTDAPASAAPASGVAAPAPPVVAEEFPDPDEDDLDDLDDVLDEFAAAPPAASGPGRPAAPATGAVKSATGASQPATATASTGGVTGLPSEADSEAFAAQLQKEMAALMGDIDQSPEMQKQLDAMMEELSMGVPSTESPEARKAAASVAAVAAAAAAASSSSASGGDAGAGGADFQDTIRKTMERMQASGQQAGAAAASEAGETDMLEALLREMATGGGDGGGGEEDFSKMLMGMMEQLTNKEILYEPMKDLHDKFPAWMKENEGKVDAKDWERYQEQQRLVGEIVGRFEREGHSDENAQDREFIVERMQKMQAAGSPPGDLVGDMKETQDALGDLDAGCPQQ